MNPIAFEMGPFSVHWYGILIALAFCAGLILANYHTNYRRLDPDKFFNLLIVMIPAALIGARLYYVLFNLHYYIAYPAEIVAVWHGGLAIHGGIIGGFLAVLVVTRRDPDLKFWSVADVIAPSLVIGQAIGRWGNFLNQEAHGGPVSESFISEFPHFIQQGMYIDGQYYHPTFLYESLWDTLIFLFLFWLIRKKSTPDGIIFLLYLLLYSAGRFIIESLRTDSLMLGSFKIAQVISIAAILLSVVLLFVKLRKKKPI
ncbi:prolipoprotein diacylglyceryl transferase [Dehalobacter restrictus]|uniref:Phosphatidylglycerol--prolipoprotein diacylglyceryl transferase n=1 Tax=Dehalobacter restrictus (strain DSM 9455 / PER-K23) TaxID=871738 RepID=A0ABM5P6Y8_DEHRP|nr:prolipoprotein diacylglyceryl transferase [Dehalobacter restrictus]AHF10381.1 prolipoprotein diacylglyceryl transferase [Dehalobacter restrictus DSM 9455]